MPRKAAARGDVASKPPGARPSSYAVLDASVLAAATAEPPMRRERVTTATIPAKFRGRARRDAAAFYLSQLARGVLAGELALATGEHQMTLATSEFVVLEIEAKQKKRANHVTVKLRWPRRPLIRIAPAGESRNGG